MSIFSKLKASKKAAKEHKAAEKQKDPETAVVIPYKHTPTHAAVDALSGAPSSWSRDDRSKIKAQHKRRSEMVMSRTPSSLSTMSYMNPGAGSSSQVPPLPRNSSYSSFNPTWFDKSDGVIDSRQNRYRPHRGHSYHDSGLGPSPLGSDGQSKGTSSTQLEQASLSLTALQSQLDNRLTSSTEASPVVSSGNSTNSNNSSDNLEIAGSKRPPVPESQITRGENGKPQGTVFAEQDIFDRLHTSTQRKLGEAPLHDTPPGPKPRTPTKAAPVAEVKQKKQRWSLLGKKNTAAVAS
ncbi:hypothetical protein BKA64DRAFT_137607 [Cadophora sp. MPI-SDFR-AT-0126]|nr:hypothetical protein BKA64DRAFT_137607 [Leotiomycetes sp. MPI-SDFR-AT-0126]